MPEWSNGLPWKGSVGETSPRVRIPLSPHKTLGPDAFSIGVLCFTKKVGFEKRRRAPSPTSGASGARSLSWGRELLVELERSEQLY
jgi:hypothetical protein